MKNPLVISVSSASYLWKTELDPPTAGLIRLKVFASLSFAKT